MRVFAALLVGLCIALAAGCGDDDDPTSTPVSSFVTGPPTPTVDSAQQQLRDQLAAILLQPADLPPGLEPSAPDFSTNEELAGPSPEELRRLIETGRQLGVDVQYVPTDRLDPAEPAKGVQSSASIYTAPEGASETFQETATQARTNDWEANYPELEDVQVVEIERPIGDESLWLRISGLEACQALFTNTPDANGTVPSATCEGKRRVVFDNVLFRVGRVRAFVMMSGLFATQSEPDIYVPLVEVWCNLVAGRARQTFGS